MPLFAFIQNLNTPEIILFALVLLLFFGAKLLPGLFQSLGRCVREIKLAKSELGQGSVDDTENTKM